MSEAIFIVLLHGEFEKSDARKTAWRRLARIVRRVNPFAAKTIEGFYTSRWMLAGSESEAKMIALRDVYAELKREEMVKDLGTVELKVEEVDLVDYEPDFVNKGFTFY